MDFSGAWKELLSGNKVKRPFWSGYWQFENGTIMMHCCDGEVKDIRNTDDVVFTFSNIASKDWEVV